MCYMSPLLHRAPRSNKMFVFYDFETTQNTNCTYTSFEHKPNLVCVKQFCAMCEDTLMWITEGAVRGNSFWRDSVDDFISCVFKSRPAKTGSWP